MKGKALAGDYAEYFEWLMNIVGGEEWWDGMDETFIRLFERKFYWRTQLDGLMKNHSVDLRAKAIRIGKILPIYVPNDEPSVLEVLVILSTKISYDIMYDPDRDPVEEVPLYFRDLVEALNFNTDACYIDQEIDRFLSGETRIADCGKDDATLWQQCNQFYRSRWDLENPSEWE